MTDINDKLKEGIAAFGTGDRDAARQIFAELLMTDLYNEQAWLWLLACVDSVELKRYCFSWILALNPRNQIVCDAVKRLEIPTLSSWVAPILVGSVPEAQDTVGKELIDVYVAGVMYENRYQNILRLSLREQVWLQREPDNAGDKNAIRVIKQNGQKIGYVRREVAANLAPYMDLCNERLRPATVTELNSNTSGSEFRVKICFYAPPGCLELQTGRVSKAHRSQEVEFHYDDSGPNIYLVLNSSEKLLGEIKVKLLADGLEYTRSGLCYRPANNGRQYQWYLRFDRDSGVTQEKVEESFRKNFNVAPDRERINALEDAEVYEVLAEEAESAKQGVEQEVRKWKDTSLILQADLEQKEDLLDDCQRELKKQNTEPIGSPQPGLAEILECLLPDIDLLRDSMDTLLSEVKEPKSVLRLLNRLNHKPETVKAESFECADGWRELRFGGDGRMYFKRFSGNCKVLISFKRHQRHDERYLKTIK